MFHSHSYLMTQCFSESHFGSGANSYLWRKNIFSPTPPTRQAFRPGKLNRNSKPVTFFTNSTMLCVVSFCITVTLYRSRNTSSQRRECASHRSKIVWFFWMWAYFIHHKWRMMCELQLRVTDRPLSCGPVMVCPTRWLEKYDLSTAEKVLRHRGLFHSELILKAKLYTWLQLLCFSNLFMNGLVYKDH